MDVPIHYGINNHGAYEILRAEINLVAELLGEENYPNKDIELLGYKEYIKEGDGVTFPNAQIEEAFKRKVGCNHEPLTETMLEMLIKTLNKEKDKLRGMAYKKSWLETKIF